MKWKKFECAIYGQRLIIIKTARKLNTIDENKTNKRVQNGSHRRSFENFESAS